MSPSPRLSASRPHCDVCGWAEVSLSLPISLRTSPPRAGLESGLAAHPFDAIDLTDRRAIRRESSRAHSRRCRRSTFHGWTVAVSQLPEYEIFKER